MNFMKISALILAFTFAILCCGCIGDQDGSGSAVTRTPSQYSLPQSSNDVIALAAEGEITELPIKIGTSVEDVVEMIINSGVEASPRTVGDDLMRYELPMETSEGEEASPLFFYKKGHKDKGISILVSTSEAYGLSCGTGTDAEDIINWIGKDVKYDREPTSKEDMFFYDFVDVSGFETLKYQAGNYILRFIIDNNIHKDENGDNCFSGLTAVTLTNPAELEGEE